MMILNRRCGRSIGGYAEYLDAQNEEYIASKIEEAEKG